MAISTHMVLNPNSHGTSMTPSGSHGGFTPTGLPSDSTNSIPWDFHATSKRLRKLSHGIPQEDFRGTSMVLPMVLLYGILVIFSGIVL